MKQRASVRVFQPRQDHETLGSLVEHAGLEDREEVRLEARPVHCSKIDDLCLYGDALDVPANPIPYVDAEIRGEVLL